MKWRMVDHWGAKIEEDFPKLKPEERVHAATEMIKLILAHKALAPNTVPEILEEVEKMFDKQREKLREPEVPASEHNPGT